MSMSSSYCFSSSDLLCGEDSGVIFSECGSDSQEYASDLESIPPELEDSISELLEEERALAGITSRRTREPIDAAARRDSVTWILKVQRHYGFQPLTAFLSVNYFDRFLYTHPLPKINGWPLQLLSVACLSLAAKLEEPLMPSLLDLQVGDAKFIFEPTTIKRMELIVLTVLDWRLRSVSPFCYFKFFSLKIDPSGTYSNFVASKAKDLILSTIRETSIIEYKPSCVAAAAILCAASSLKNLSFTELWRDGLHKDDIMSCYQKIHQISMKSELQVMNVSNSSDSSPPHYKRRRLSNVLWEDGDKGGVPG